MYHNQEVCRYILNCATKYVAMYILGTICICFLLEQNIFHFFRLNGLELRKTKLTYYLIILLSILLPIKSLVSLLEHN